MDRGHRVRGRFRRSWRRPGRLQRGPRILRLSHAHLSLGMAAAPLLPCPLHRPGSRTAAAAGPQTPPERQRRPCVPTPNPTLENAMHLSTESLLIILFVGLVAGWLAGQVVRGAG